MFYLCSHLDHCLESFFEKQLLNARGLSEVIQAEFCMGHHHECARYKIIEALGEKAVPYSLYPTELARADEMIAILRQDLLTARA